MFIWFEIKSIRNLNKYKYVRNKFWIRKIPRGWPNRDLSRKHKPLDISIKTSEMNKL